MRKVNGIPVVRCPACGLVQFWREGKTRCARPGCPHEVTWTLTEKMEMVPDMPVGDQALLFNKKAFAARLALVRRGRGLSQRAMADRSGLARTYISKIERGGALPTIASLEIFCKALGVPMVQLLDELLTADDIALRSDAELGLWQEFLWEIAEALPNIARHDWDTLLHAAKGMASGQYVLPEWMAV